ncbi:threonine-phosphate decarboxylase [Methanocella sp. CWC-04]|uniref:threonine-phosphate decarboxylase n=1 Tax=Methanooceanicella nereidis TaxID=2052831 RepID=A0AAP2RFM2_9EURY|nr:threonine-phosphate decarboxylase [Methanocella sp. CWC-04]
MFKVRKELQGLAPCAHGGKLQEIAEQNGFSESEFLDFSVNINPYQPMDVRDVIAKAYGSVSRYPDNRYERFKRSAAKFTGARMENIVPGNGSTEIIRLLAESILERGDLIAIPCPTFGEYEQQCRLFGANIRYVRYSDLIKKEYWHLNGCVATFLCNPNNPDGVLLPAEDVLSIADHCKKNGIILVVDEAFIDLADPGQSVAKYVEKYDNLFVMRSLTKCFAIPGFRLGFGITNAETAGILNVARVTWNLSSIASEVGIYYMENSHAYLDVSRSYITRERDWLMKNISAIEGLNAYPSTVNYFLVDVSGTGMNCPEFASRILKEKIIVRECNSFRMLGESFIRLAVRTREENDRLVQALKNVAGA